MSFAGPGHAADLALVPGQLAQFRSVDGRQDAYGVVVSAGRDPPGVR